MTTTTTIRRIAIASTSCLAITVVLFVSQVLNLESRTPTVSAAMNTNAVKSGTTSTLAEMQTEPTRPNYLHSTLTTLPVVADYTEITPVNAVEKLAQKEAIDKVTVAGVEVVLEPGSLFSALADNELIGTLQIKADRVIVRGVWHFPLTDVVIAARELVFEDDEEEEPSRIDTSPKPYVAGAIEVNANGADGKQAGDIFLLVNQIITPEIVDPIAVEPTRFVLHGSDGQRGGPADKRAGTYDVTVALKHVVGQWHVLDSLDGKIKYEVSVTMKANGNSKVMKGTAEGKEKKLLSLNGAGTITGVGPKQDVVVVANIWKHLPRNKNGIDLLVDQFAKTPDTLRAGHGQQTRSFRANALPTTLKFTPRIKGLAMDVSSSLKLEVKRKYREFAGEHGVGGAGGMLYAIDSRSQDLAELSGGRTPDEDEQAADGEFTLLDAVEYRSLTPEALRLVVEWIEDLHFGGYDEQARQAFHNYLDITSDDDLSDPELAPLCARLVMLGQRFANDTDFYGNHSGYVPLLSFEKLHETYTTEIEQGMKIFALAYQLEKAYETQDERRVHAKRLIDELGDELNRYRREHRNATRTIPELLAEIAAIEDDLEPAFNQLAAAEDAIKAEHRIAGKREKLRAAIEASLQMLAFAGGKGLVASAVGTSVISQLDDGRPVVPSQGDTEALREMYVEHESEIQQQYAALRAADVTDVETFERDLNELSVTLSRTTRQMLEENRAAAAVTEDNLVLQDRKQIDPAVQKHLDQVILLVTKHMLYRKKLAEAMLDAQNCIANMQQVSRDAASLEAAVVHAQPSSDMRATFRSLERRAKTRLLRYRYELIKAWEYRMLQEFDGAKRSNRLFQNLRQDIDRLIADESNKDVSALVAQLTKAFMSECLKEMKFSSFQHMSRQYSSLKDPLPIMLSQAELDRLNSAGEVRIDLGQRTMADDEFDGRLANVRITQLHATVDGQTLANSRLTCEVAKRSRIRGEADTFDFRYGDASASRIVMAGFRLTRPADDSGAIRYSTAVPSGGRIDLSDRDSKMLDALNGRATAQAVHVRPGADTELVIRVNDPQVMIERVVVECTVHKLIYSTKQVRE